MPFIKVTYSSPRNVSVIGSDYVEVEDDDLEEDGSVSEQTQARVWQEAVNEFMSDTYIELVENEGD